MIARLLTGEVLLTTIIRRGLVADFRPCSDGGCSGWPIPRRTAALASRPIARPCRPGELLARRGHRQARAAHASASRLPGRALPERHHLAPGRRDPRANRSRSRVPPQAGFRGWWWCRTRYEPSDWALPGSSVHVGGGPVRRGPWIWPRWRPSATSPARPGASWSADGWSTFLWSGRVWGTPDLG